MNRRNRVLGALSAVLRKFGLISDADLPVRPLTPDSGAFENYIDYFFAQYGKTIQMSWMGKKCQKFPFDAWVYQEIIFESVPDVVIEVGSLYGGSTLFLASMLDLQKRGNVIAIDIDHSMIDFTHPRIHWITGNATSEEVLSKVRSLIGPHERVMVIEDSSHTYENTLAVLRSYSPFVTKGMYFIVEDGVCYYPFITGPKPGPFEAVKDFLGENADFEVDKSKEKFVLTLNPSGYLRRVQNP